MLTLNEYVETRIRAIFTDLARAIGDGRIEVDDPDIAAAIPLGLMRAEDAMIQAWRAYLDEIPEVANGR